MNDDWSDAELDLIIADYFAMFSDEVKGIKYNKSAHRRKLLPLLNNRNDASVEFKRRNISAVLVEMDLPFIKGYLPAYHFQRKPLISRVGVYLGRTPKLEDEFKEFSDTVPDTPKSLNFSGLVVQPPKRKKPSEKFEIERKPIKINYLEREQNNRRLGLKGEELAMEYERFNLMKSGKEALAEKVEWVSKELGDGLGYDILSKNLNGTDKYLEVKTTKLGKQAPFFFSSNEYKFSREHKPNYHLYRVFNFNENPKMFILNGSFDDFCRVEAVQYRGKF